MDEMASLWDYQESCDMEHNLLYTSLEVDKLRAQMKDEMKKNNAYVKQLIHLLKLAIQQRDEAQNQLQNILKNTTQMPVSSISESNSLSEPFNYRSRPHDLVVNQPLIKLLKTDQRSRIIDTIAKERVLPQKGQLLKAVVEAGPLLRTLVMAGPLPTWRNPPHLQHFNGCDSEMKSALNVGRGINRSVNSQAYAM